MLSHPMCEVLLTQVPRGQRHQGDDALRVIRNKIPAIERQEQLHGHKGYALVAIDKGMIAGQAKSISRRESRHIRLAVFGQLKRALHGRLEQARIPYAAPPAMLGQLLFMNRPHDLSVQPDPLERTPSHFANSLSTCRRLLMNFRAASIWVSKSAS